MSDSGHWRRFDPSADHFRSTPINGHHLTSPAGPFRANNGHLWGPPFTNLNIERLFANSPVRHSRFAHALGNPRTLCETGRIVRWRTGVEVGEREIGIESEPRLYRSPRLLHPVEMSQRCGKIEVNERGNIPVGLD